MTVDRNIAWLEGKWGSTSELFIPIKDRGLKLGDGIFETILVLNGHPQLLEEHLNRWYRNASLLGMKKPPSSIWLAPIIKEAIQRACLQESNGALRLNWSRGDQYLNGINMSANTTESQNHRFWLELNITELCFKSITALISSHERRNTNSLISQCKTFSYSQSIQARREATIAGYDEAILLNTNGEICCGTTSNLIIRRHSQWLTPPLTSGCLPGIMRLQGLKKGLIKETKLAPKPKNNDQWILINSLSCRPLTQVNNFPLKPWSDPESLWRSLL